MKDAMPKADLLQFFNNSIYVFHFRGERKEERSTTRLTKIKTRKNRFRASKPSTGMCIGLSQSILDESR